MATTVTGSSSTGDWRKTVQDSTERKVLEALSDPAWDFRTIPGIAAATGLKESQVAGIIQKYSDLIRQSLVRDRNGQELFTLRERPLGAKEFVAEIRSFITKSL